MSALREFLSNRGRKALFEARRLAGIPRSMPHFMMIGAQKSGTSSLFAYLKQHPQIVRPIFKEPFFFDRHYERGLKWYGCNFPSRGAIDRLDDIRGKKHLTFEATASYVFGADVPLRIARDVETRKFILLLRNPVERAISAYWHACRMGRETRPLMDALEAELHHLGNGRETGAAAKTGSDEPRPAYVRRGIYHEAVSHWQAIFSPRDILVLQSETMFADPRATMVKVLDFLELPQTEQINFEPQNVGGYGTSDAEARKLLEDFYRPHNAELNRISQAALNW